MKFWISRLIKEFDKWCGIKIFQWKLRHSKCTGRCNHCGLGQNNIPCSCGYDELKEEFTKYLNEH